MSAYSSNLRQDLKQLALQYAQKNNIVITDKYEDAVVFTTVKDNFQVQSFNNIEKHPRWLQRLSKIHSQVPGAVEMQSSNSSDSLLMNIFCYPKIKEWKSIRDLLDLQSIHSIEFGYNPILNVYGKPEASPTEVDLHLNGTMICEAKLTEIDFTAASKTKIESYEFFDDVFDKSALPQNETEYFNYQLIRNIIAAYKENKRFILFCDMRRPDLIKAFHKTVSYVKNINLRSRCNFITWQDISRCVGKDLKEFLLEKYGIC